MDLTKTLMHEFHYDCMRPRYGGKVRLCYMNTDSFVYEIGTEHFYRDIAKDVEERFIRVDIQRMKTSHCPSEKNKK